MSWIASLFGWSPRSGTRAAPVVEYLPDADEIAHSPPPPLARWTLHILLLALVSFLVWACVSELDEVVSAPGRLASPLPNVVVQPLETSIVQSVSVRVGQVVHRGDPLATLDATFAQADATQLQTRFDSLQTQIQGLEAELRGDAEPLKDAHSPDAQLQASLLAERRANFRAQQSRLNENLARLRAELATNAKDQQLVRERLRSVREIQAMQEKVVAQKYGAPLQLLEAQQRTTEVEREQEQVLSREQTLRREWAALEAEKTGFERNWRQKTMEDLLAATRERDDVAQQLQKADKRSRLVTLSAPIDAVVLDIAHFSPGSIVQGAQTFFTLVPLNTRLEVEVQIDAKDVGHIKPGLPVQVKVDAYPFQRHGMLKGSVRTVSNDAFRRDENSRSAADSYYVARIEIVSNGLHNMADASGLLPGMSVNAEIVVGKRTVISYLAWPLTKGLDEAVREPR